MENNVTIAINDTFIFYRTALDQPLLAGRSLSRHLQVNKIIIELNVGVEIVFRF